MRDSMATGATAFEGIRQFQHKSRAARAWIALRRFFQTKPLGAMGGVLVLLMVLTALLADVLAPYSPLEVHPPLRLTPPGGQFLLGTDELGRDILSRLIYGSRSSLQAGFAVLGMGTTAGIIIGITSGYFRGKYDLIIQRVMDAFQAFPLLILALAIVAMLGQSFLNVVLALSIVLAPGVSRVLRASTLSVQQSQYVDAAVALGASHLRILLQHILPNVVAPIIVLASIELGTIILVEASLSFLGLGTPPPTPTWGGMLSGPGRRFMERAPWMAVFPGIAISLAILGFNLFGDALRDVLDPRLRGR